MKFWRRVKAIRPKLHPRMIGTQNQLRKRQGVSIRRHHVVGEHYVTAIAAKHSRRKLRQPRFDLACRILPCLAIEIAAGGCRRRGGIRNFARIGGGAAHVMEADAELGRHHLCNLGIQALPHLRAAMIYQHRAVGVDVHQRAGLIVMNHIERDAELRRRECQPFPEHRTFRIEDPHRLAAFAIVAACLQFSDEFMNNIVFNGHAVVRGVAFRIVGAVAIKIQFSYVERIFIHLAGDIVDDVFHHDCALRATETAEGGVGLGVGLAGHGADIDVAQVVGVVDMAQRTCRNGPG